MAPSSGGSSASRYPHARLSDPRRLEEGDCVLRAPFNGEIAARTADPAASCIRARRSSTSSIVRSCVSRGTCPRSIWSRSRPGPGEVSRRAPSSDPGTRTIRFEVDLPYSSREIAVGTTTAEVVVKLGEPVPATEIPFLAANVRGKTGTVFVVDGSTAKKTSMSAISERGGNLFVKTELAPETQVVTQCRPLLENNPRVVAKLECVSAKCGGV